MNKRGLVSGYNMKFLLCDVSKTFTETIFKALNGTIRHTQCALNGTLWVQVIHTLSLAGLFNFFNFILKQIAV